MIRSRIHCGLIFYKNKLYIFSGEREFDEFASNELWELNLDDDILYWKKIEIRNVKSSIKDLSCNVYKDTILIFGEDSEYGIKSLYSIDIMNKIMIKLVEINNIFDTIYQHKSCVLNDKLYILGGNNKCLYCIDLQNNYNGYIIEYSFGNISKFNILSYNNQFSFCIILFSILFIRLIHIFRLTIIGYNYQTQVYTCYPDIQILVLKLIRDLNLFIPNGIIIIIQKYIGLIFKKAYINAKNINAIDSIISCINKISYLIIFGYPCNSFTFDKFFCFKVNSF